MSSRKVATPLSPAQDGKLSQAQRLRLQAKSPTRTRSKPTKRVKESAYDLALRTGFLGAISGGPKDLATNKKYFEGFGQ